MLRGLMVLCLGVVLSVAASARPAGDPVAVAQRIYQQYIDANRAHKDVPSLDGVYTPGLRRLIKQAGAHECDAIESDPLIDAQDILFTSDTVEVVSQTAARAVLSVSLLNGEDGKTTKIVLEMVAVDGGWKIDNIRYADHRDLRTMIRDGIKACRGR